MRTPCWPFSKSFRCWVNEKMSALLPSHQRAIDDLFKAERDLRQKSEGTINALRKVLIDTANRFDGKRYEALRRSDAAIPDNWGAAEWRSFFEDVPVPSWGWHEGTAADFRQQRALESQLAELQQTLLEAQQDLEQERAKNAAAPGQPNGQAEIMQPVRMNSLEELPEHMTPAFPVMVADSKKQFENAPKKTPAEFAGILEGGSRAGGDLMRVVQRYWICLYLIGRWKLVSNMEIESVLAETVGVSSGSGSLRRVLKDLARANILTTEITELRSPHTTLRLNRLTGEGERIYQSLFGVQPMESDWSRLIRLHEGERYPGHALAVLAFTLHARKRGWAAAVMPQVSDSKARPDACVIRGQEKWFVEVELGEKENTAKWRNLHELNGGRVVLCSSTPKTRARLVADCQLDHLPGLATDLETLVRGNFKQITPASQLWLMQW